MYVVKCMAGPYTVSGKVWSQKVCGTHACMTYVCSHVYGMAITLCLVRYGHIM